MSLLNKQDCLDRVVQCLELADKHVGHVSRASSDYIQMAFAYMQLADRLLGYDAAGTEDKIQDT